MKRSKVPVTDPFDKSYLEYIILDTHPNIKDGHKYLIDEVTRKGLFFKPLPLPSIPDVS